MRNQAAFGLVRWFSAALALMSCACSVPGAQLTLSCAADNDLFLVLSAGDLALQRFDTPGEAISHAPQHSGVLILAEGYPANTTLLDADLFARAARKDLRLYVEYPSFLPGVTLGAPRGTHWERVAVASEAFAPELAPLRILAIHGCRFVPLVADNPQLVIGRVAGYDTAVYGLASESFPILFNLPKKEDAGEVLVATTKLSQFLSGRYAPSDAWQSIWNGVLAWLCFGKEPVRLNWTPRVRPSFGAAESLPADVEQQALRRGIDWYFNARMLVHPAMMAKYNRPTYVPPPPSDDLNVDQLQDWPYGYRVARMPDPGIPCGDGTLGVLEGFDAKIFPDGTQPVRWWRRADCNAETAGAFALAGAILDNPLYRKTGGNIGDWLAQSVMSLGDRADPDNPAYGLMGWNDVDLGDREGYGEYYGDDNARTMLGLMVTAAALGTERYDERLAKCLLANLRFSSQLGFQPDRYLQEDVEKDGWQHHFHSQRVSYAPHFQASMWACYLWAYRQTGYELFMQRARSAIEMTMAAYPDGWQWTNGIQQERAKMLLVLAWLTRVENTAEHRAWLRRMAEDLLADQAPCGAIREKIGEAGKGGYPPPASNEAYGTNEAPLIQSNDDAASDLLYTCNFALLALHEAAAATGDPYYRQAEDRLAGFLCRIQIRSETHPEFDGGWYRCFDFNRWEYWASSTDAGWGAWCIETGWTQSWITICLALRQMRTSLWDLTASSKVGHHFATLQPRMIKDTELAPPPSQKPNP